MSEAAHHNRKLASENLGRLVRLIANEDYRWCLLECVVKEQTRLDGIIHTRAKPIEERDDALSQWTALERVRLWAETFANDCGQTLGHTQRISLDITEPKSNAEPNPTIP